MAVHPIVMKRKPVLALDADEVMLDFSGYWQGLAETRLGRKLPRYRRHYHFMDRHGLSRDDYNQVWDYFREVDGWSNVPLLPCIGDTLDCLAEDFRLVVVTGIPKEALEPRKACFRRWGLPIEETFATGHRDQTKQRLLEVLAPVGFADDRPHHLREAADAGVKALFWVDRDCEVPDGTLENLVRLSSLREILLHL